MSIHSKRQLLAELGHDWHSIKQYVMYRSDNMFRRFVDLIKRVDNALLLQEMLSHASSFPEIYWKEIEKHVVCVEFHIRFKWDVEALSFEARMRLVDIGINPMIFGDAISLHHMINWQPTKFKSLPRWMQRSLKEFLLCARRIAPQLDRNVRNGIVNMIITSNLLLIHHGFKLGEKPNLKKRKVSQKNALDEMYKAVVVSHNLSVKDCHAQACLAYQTYNVAFIATLCNRPQWMKYQWQTLWNALFVDLEAFLVFGEACMTVLSTWHISQVVFNFPQDKRLALFYVKACQYHQKWDSIYRIQHIPGLLELATQYGMRWHEHVSPVWNSGWFNWTIEKHNNPGLFTLHFRKQVDVVLDEVDWLPTKARHLIVRFVAFYYGSFHLQHHFKTTKAGFLLHMKNQLHRSLRHRIPTAKDSMEHIMLVNKRLRAEDALIRLE